MGKDTEVEQPPVEQPEAEVPEPEVQELVLPTNKEELDALLAGATERGKLEAEDVYKGIQRTLNKKNDEIERLTKKQVQPPETNDDFSLFEAMIADRKGKAEYENDPVTAKMEADLATRKQRQSRDAQVRYQDKVINDSREKFNKQIEDAGLDPNDERLDAFHDAFEDATEDGRFGKAERKLNRVLSKVEPKKGEPKKESEDERINKLVDAKLLEEMRKRNMLKTDNNQPSGAGSSDEEFERKMGSGELAMTPENMKRAQEILNKRQMGG